MEHDSGRGVSGLQEYFDEDHSGTLEKGEVIRALIKTFRLSSDLSKVRNPRSHTGSTHILRTAACLIYPTHRIVCLCVVRSKRCGRLWRRCGRCSIPTAQSRSTARSSSTGTVWLTL